jgi:hemoglobin
MRFAVLAGALLAVLTLPACRGGHRAPAGATLYQRLGGGAGLSQVVEDFLDEVMADSRINHYFVDSDMSALKTSFVNLIGQATGGPEHYQGPDLTSVHAKLAIGADDFAAFMEDFKKTLDKDEVKNPEKSELLELMTAMKSQVVTR